MDSAVIIRDICDVGNLVERYFNIAACVPVLGKISGSIRHETGGLQFAFGVILGIMGGVCSLTTNNKNWNQVCYLGGKFLLHGALNVLRGRAEDVVGTNILRSPCLILPNLLTNFEPVISYDFSFFKHN